MIAALLSNLVCLAMVTVIQMISAVQDFTVAQTIVAGAHLTTQMTAVNQV